MFSHILLYRDFSFGWLRYLWSKFARILLFSRIMQGEYVSLTSAFTAFNLFLYSGNKKKVSCTIGCPRVVKCRQKTTTTKRRGRSGEEKEVLSGELITSRWINDSDISNKSCQTLTPEPAPLPLSLSPSLSPFFPFMLSLFCPLILYTLSSRPSECGQVLPFIFSVSFPGQTVQINNVHKLSSNSSSS